MMRKHIPYEVRCRVIMRQLGLTPAQIETNIALEDPRNHGMGYERYCELLEPRLRSKLGVISLHLDHDPALENRAKFYAKGHAGSRKFIDYDPPQHDPNFLIYREGGFRGSAHDIKTRVRGERGQFADNVIAKRERRRQRKLTKPKRKRTWGSRKLRSRNDLRRRHK